MTHLTEIQGLRDKARALGHVVILFYNESGVMDQVWIVLKQETRARVGSGLYDPLSAAELLRKVCA
jgi:hypothetical protein